MLLISIYFIKGCFCHLCFIENLFDDQVIFCTYSILPTSEIFILQQIFDQLCSLDVKGQSYIFEVSKNLTKLYDNMAQLLAHPLQRPLQKDTSNRIRANMEEG